ncbi:MAG: acyltransferase family protein [Asticcacaulis sp.]
MAKFFFIPKARQMQPDQIKPLTSLRFFAAVWVVVYTYIKELDLNVHFGLIEHGYLGVDLFFVLSGFILSFVYLEAFGQGRFNYGTFITHRLARIYPLHIATLAFTLLLVGAAAIKGVQLDANAGNLAALPAHLLLVQAWGLAPTPSFNHPSWSISAEWFAYLGFPAVAWMAWKLRQRPMLAVALAALFLTLLYTGFEAVAGFSLTHATFQWGALRIVPAFLLGASLYLAYRGGAVNRPAVAMGGALAASLILIAASSYSRSDVIIVMACGLLVLSMSGLGRDGTGILSSPILVYLGEISFATYMIYVPWKWIYLKAVNGLLGTDHHPLPFVWWFAGLLALVPLSMLAHHLIEVPCRRIVRRFGEGMLVRFGPKLARQG